MAAFLLHHSLGRHPRRCLNDLMPNSEVAPLASAQRSLLRGVSEGSANPIRLSRARRGGWHLECSGDAPEPCGVDIGR